MSRLLLMLIGCSATALMFGLWIPLKALAAQELLALAWAESQARQVEARPWPWADTWPVARLDMPELGVSMIVLDGMHGESLAFGPGRVQAGAHGPVILAGHRDTHFSHLQHLTPGSELRLQGKDQHWQSYRVTDIRVVDSRSEWIDTHALGADTLLLVTCYPFDALDARGPLRYVVQASPVYALEQKDTVAAL
ncbi:class GN sortase [Marinobacter halophilus]|uniref:Class GN sortase n=1 Tax=Marinobacter halophilus TaxID=1323740 RepID=A0A2T1KFK2_9GAMM|nr:class GN sortase [Marinobacter halophilus]PSF08911.1 class GN sortase [Marinobacter halophilus]GGC65030.1 class GN sortase [Marinobacter halophilus]